MVVKLGTGILTGRRKQIDPRKIEQLVEQVAAQHKDGREVVVVSSGAVGAGMGVLNIEKRPTDLSDLQACAAVGQSALMSTYSELFAKYNLKVAQVLLTHDDLEDQDRHLNARNTIVSLLDKGVIPIVNENDAVSYTELKFGDNDRLSAIVAIVVKAEKLVLITNQEGLFDSDPEKSNNAEKINYIEYDSEELAELIPLSATGEGVGGFSTKIMASQMAGFSGIPTQIITWSDECIKKVVNSEDIGTLVRPSSKKVKLKKLWIAYGMPIIGKIIIDDGAKNALTKDASLLSIGIKEIKVPFEINDGVEIFDSNDLLIAKGISKISSKEFSLGKEAEGKVVICLLYTSPSPRD